MNTLHNDLIELAGIVASKETELLSTVMLPLLRQYQRVELGGIDYKGMRFTIFNQYKPDYAQESIKEQYEELGFNVYSAVSEDGGTAENPRFKVYFNISVTV
jgi:hypothetical protein